jgi:Flp pilus assembly protein TadG
MTTKILRSCRPSAEEGSALVELALSLPVLLLILLGAAEFARCAYAAIEVVNAAHAAAIYAASSAAASGDSGGITNAATADAGNLFGSNAISVTSVTPSCTCANTAYTPSSCSDNQTCYSHNTAMVTAITVQTQATYHPLIVANVGGLAGIPSQFTMTGQSTQVVSNQ